MSEIMMAVQGVVVLFAAAGVTAIAWHVRRKRDSQERPQGSR